MRLKIVQVGERVLRQRARALQPDEILKPATQELIAWMRETMRDAPGVGLAAPQVGLGVQLAVIEDRSEYSRDIPAEKRSERGRLPVPFHVIINPRIVEQSNEEVEFFEGCLSLAGFSALVKRSHHVAVEYLDERGESRRIEAEGWYARILQHEIDHLYGRLYIDRMDPRSFMSIDNLTRNWKDMPIAQVHEALTASCEGDEQ